jgi:selenocysteine lyase/cysteine desulfurase
MREDLARAVTTHMGGGGVVQTVTKEGRIVLDAPYKFHFGTPQNHNIRALDMTVRFLTYSGLTYFEQDVEGLRRFLSDSGMEKLEKLAGKKPGKLAAGLRRYLLEDENKLSFKLVERAMNNILRHERELTGYLIERLTRELGDEIEIIGPKSMYEGDKSYLQDRIGVVSIRSKTKSVEELSNRLDRMEFAVRSGCHCWHIGMRELGLMEGMSTGPNDGAVRFSLTHFNTKEEVDRVINALKKIHSVG